MKVIPSLALVGAACLLGTTLGSAQVADSAADPRGTNLSLRELSKGFEEAIERIRLPLAQLDSSYVNALDRLLQSETASGNPNQTVAVKAELNEFQSGTRFDPRRFDARSTDFAPLERLRATYRTERRRLQKSLRKELEILAQSYAARLAEIERSLTRAGDIEAAILVRNARTSMEDDPRLAADSPESEGLAPFNGRLHVVAKAEIEIRHNDRELNYLNSAPLDKRHQYTDALTREALFRNGDVIQFRMRSNVVFRSFIATLESTDGSVSVPLRTSDYRYLGAGDRLPVLDAAAILRVDDLPEPGSPDPVMEQMWRTKPVPASSRHSSEWAKCGPGDEWHTYAVVIDAGMISEAEEERP